MFEPDPEKECCKKRCMSHFVSANDARVVAARESLLDPSLTKLERKRLARQNWHTYLTIGTGDDRVRCCMTAAACIFVCSRAYLAPEKTLKRTRAEANTARAVKSVTLASWFMLLKEGLDVMPDEGWYMAPVMKRRHLYKEYLRDCARPTSSYQKCGEDYFLHVWRESFPEIRTRKHLRFAKCGFCVKWRGVEVSPKSTDKMVAEAKDRLRIHRNWTNRLERGLYHKKQEQAMASSHRFMSIAMDGTSQVINGFPHFREATKEDAKGNRLELHTQIAIVHGKAPRVMLAWENIAGDPNWTIQCLYNVLKHEERERDRLPPVLYLQLDNCTRENKNTYLFAYLCWLVERHVFEEVFVSYLPTGHTHFDPDQFASRMSVAMQHSDILSLMEYIQLIKKCSTPKANVELVEDVMDVKHLFNPSPSENAAFPVGTSRCHMARGLCTKSVQPGREWYMDPTSPLHWWVRRDADAKVVVMTKFTVEDENWSTTFYPWTQEAPRPQNRPVVEGFSCLETTDITIAPSKPLSAERVTELWDSLQKIQHRLTTEQWDGVLSTFLMVSEPSEPRDADPCEGSFCVDFLDPNDEHDHALLQPEKNGGLLLFRPTTLFPSQSAQNSARELRKTRGHASEPLVVGNFIAYVVHYTDDFPEDQKQDFWVGKITELDVPQRQVKVRKWNTGTVKNLALGERNSPQYKAYRNQTEWMTLDRVLQTFQLTERGNRIEAGVRRYIANALIHYKTATEAASQNSEVAVGIGADVLFPQVEVSSDAP